MKRNCILEFGSDWRGDTVAFRVEIVANLDGVARVALVQVFVQTGLEQKRVFAFRRSLDQ